MSVLRDRVQTLVANRWLQGTPGHGTGIDFIVGHMGAASQRVLDTHAF
jgi:hypothetical protein